LNIINCQPSLYSEVQMSKQKRKMRNRKYV
jgi:hypothetical protein